MSINTLVLCSLFAALIAAGAVAGTMLPIRFGPISITFQGLFVLLTGFIMGKRLGPITVILYIMIGLLGIPVFANFGSGFGYVLSPTFGFLLGFIPMSYVTARIAGNDNPSYLRLFVASLVARIPLYLIGLTYFYLIKNFYLGQTFGMGKVFYFCFILFIPSDTLSQIISIVLAKRLIPITKKML